MSIQSLKKIAIYNYTTGNNKWNLFLFWTCLFTLMISICRLLTQRLQIYFFNYKTNGDEGLFVKSFSYFINHGWYDSVATGSSPFFNLFVLPIYLITKNELLSFKILNIVCLIVILFSWIWFLVKQLEVNKKFALISILFLVQTGLMQNTFFMGVNDALFAVFLSFGFIYLYRGITENKHAIRFFVLSGLFFSSALSVRELLLLYLPGILTVILFAIIKKNIKIKPVLLWLLTFILFSGTIHFPSLLENKTLSMLDKNPKEIKATWAERNYLQVSKNSKSQPSWKEVLAYKKVHGETSLPNNFIKAITMNPALTLKNGLHQFYFSQMPLIRQLGFFYIFSIIYLFYLFFKRRLFKDTFLWAPLLFYGCYTFLLCIQIIPTLQFRWFVIFPFLISVFSISEITQWITKYNKMESLFYLNMIILAIANSLLIGIW